MLGLERTARMSYHARQILAPGAASRKRKEREAFYSVKPSNGTGNPPSWLSTTTSSKAAPHVRPASSANRLLAGYMAYEFLTKGTLFGREFDPARGEAEPRKEVLGSEAEPSWSAKPQHQSYAEVAILMKSDGVHIPGIVNPSQLARWIEM